MNPTVDEIVAQAETLSPAERERLVERILLTLVGCDPEVDAAWKVEVERRLDAIDRGEEESYPWEEVRKELGLG